jgi:hypothetical protein
MLVVEWGTGRVSILALECGWWQCAAVGNRKQNITFLYILVALVVGRGLVSSSCSQNFLTVSDGRGVRQVRKCSGFIQLEI